MPELEFEISCRSFKENKETVRAGKDVARGKIWLKGHPWYSLRWKAAREVQLGNIRLDWQVNLSMVFAILYMLGHMKRGIKKYFGQKLSGKEIHHILEREIETYLDMEEFKSEQ